MAKKTSDKMSRKDYEEKAELLVKTTLTELNLADVINIYDVEFVKEGSDFYLRAFIDKEGGVTIEDCELVSRAMNEKLDAEDFIKEAYIFEVSSPGLGRVLKKDRHLEYSLGEEVEIKLFEAVDAAKEYVGILKAYDKQTITLEFDENTDMSFERAKISTVRLTIDF